MDQIQLLASTLPTKINNNRVKTFKIICSVFRSKIQIPLNKEGVRNFAEMKATINFWS